MAARSCRCLYRKTLSLHSRSFALEAFPSARLSILAPGLYPFRKPNRNKSDTVHSEQPIARAACFRLM